MATNQKHSNVYRLSTQRKGVDSLTCDIYTFNNKKFRLEIQASTELEAYTTAVSYALSCDVSEIRCVVLYKELPVDINADTKPLKVHLIPKNIIRGGHSH